MNIEDNEVRIDEQVRVAIVSRMKHGDLYEAMKKRGWNQTQTAEFLGMRGTAFGRMLNLKKLPKTVPDELNAKFVELTGKMYEDLFPEELRNSKFISAEKEAVIYAEIPMPMLLNGGFVPKQLPSPEKALEESELKQLVNEVLGTLRPKDAMVLRIRFMEGRTIEEAAEKTGYKVSYIKSVEKRAMRCLRHPSRSRRLEYFFK